MSDGLHLNLARSVVKLMSSIRIRERKSKLKYDEFVVLSLLQQNGVMVVGDITLKAGILPAQMSRIIRSLENNKAHYGKSLIRCATHPIDKRKVNVSITGEGNMELHSYRTAVADSLHEKVKVVPESECVDMVAAINKLTSVIG